MRRGPTVGELRWPDTPEFMSIACAWQADASALLLGFVWQGYDLFRSEVTDRIDMAKADEDLERGITQLLEPRIHRAMTGDEPFYVQHGPYEEESRHSAKAQPPQYDIAFVLRANERVKWPLEAKILRTDGSVGEYVRDVEGCFLTCRYAPFSSEAAMVAYLFSGHAETVFSSISKALPASLEHHPSFSARPHKTSKHLRTVPPGKRYPPNFRCHHLVMDLGSCASGASSI